MKPRIATLSLALIMALLLPLSVFATTTEETSSPVNIAVADIFPASLPCPDFIDLSPGAWYADYARLACETGLLTGTGSTTFSPEGTVTVAEVMTVAARLHNLLNGGSGILPTAPETWGTGSITTPTGAVLLTFRSTDFYTSLDYRFSQDQPRRLRLYLSVSSSQLSALSPAGGGSAEAALTLNGKQVLAGTITPHTTLPSDISNPLRITVPYIEFIAAEGSDYAAFSRELASFQPAPASNLWYRDALWYVREYGIAESQPSATAFEAPATRRDVLDWLTSALPANFLTPINQVDVLPDTTEEDVLLFYRGGILSGVDEFGTFDGERTLTRAEFSAFLARIVRPDLRLTFSLTQPPSQESSQMQIG